MVDLYHQLGYRYQWNLASVREDQTGDGVIVGPRYMDRQLVTSLPLEIRSSSFFDPQFFLPSSQRGKLSTYEFFPDVIADGFSTSEYDEEFAAKSADLCIRFQIENRFRFCVIPTRHRAGTPSDFIDSQMDLFVGPFLDAYRRSSTDRPLLLQLILNDHMLKDERFRNDILSWATGLEDVSGVYLIPQVTNRRKQIGDIDFLLALLGFVRTMRLNRMEIVVGYLNTEAIPLLAADPTGITMGSYENLRMFSLAAYIEEEPGTRRGPIPRIYIPRLLQWIDHNYTGAITRFIDDLESFFDTSSYRALMFDPYYNWHFQKSEPYKHYFVVFSKQVRALSALDSKERFKAIKKLCKSALDEFQSLEASGIVFDPDSGPGHLPAWLTALNIFGQEKGP